MYEHLFSSIQTSQLDDMWSILQVIVNVSLMNNVISFDKVSSSMFQPKNTVLSFIVFYYTNLIKVCTGDPFYFINLLTTFDPILLSGYIMPCLIKFLKFLVLFQWLKFYVHILYIEWLRNGSSTSFLIYALSNCILGIRAAWSFNLSTD